MRKLGIDWHPPLHYWGVQFGLSCLTCSIINVGAEHFLLSIRVSLRFTCLLILNGPDSGQSQLTGKMFWLFHQLTLFPFCFILLFTGNPREERTGGPPEGLFHRRVEKDGQSAAEPVPGRVPVRPLADCAQAGRHRLHQCQPGEGKEVLGEEIWSSKPLLFVFLKL